MKQRTKNTKRLAGVLLALVMALCLLPVTAMARAHVSDMVTLAELSAGDVIGSGVGICKNKNVYTVEDHPAEDFFKVYRDDTLYYSDFFSDENHDDEVFACYTDKVYTVASVSDTELRLTTGGDIDAQCAVPYVNGTFRNSFGVDYRDVQEYVIVPKGESPDWSQTLEPDGDSDYIVFEGEFATLYTIYTRLKSNTALTESLDVVVPFDYISSQGYHCVGETITVTPEPEVEGLTYQWYYDSEYTQPIAGATANNYTCTAADAGKELYLSITLGGLEAGDYSTDPIEWKSIAAPADPDDYDPATVQLNANGFVYDGQVKKAIITVTWEEYTLTEGTDYTVTGTASATDPGTYTVTVTGAGDYKGQRQLTWKITSGGAVGPKAVRGETGWSEQPVIIAPDAVPAGYDTVLYRMNDGTGWTAWSTAVPMGWAAGAYTVEVKYANSVTAAESAVTAYTSVLYDEMPVSNGKFLGEEGTAASAAASAAASSFTMTTDLTDINKVTVDGKTVDPKYYTISGGSVTLSAEYMAALSAGTHTLKAENATLMSTAQFTVGAKVGSPKTGDSGIALYAAALGLSAVLGAALVIGKRRSSR